MTAALLRRIGWDALVFERGRDLGDRGAAIGTTDALLRVMQRIDPSVDRSITVETRSRRLLDRSFAVVQEAPLRGMTTAWARIYRPLRAALPDACYRPGAALTTFLQYEDR